MCGPSGEVNYPDYMEDIHVQWLTDGSKSVPAPSLDTPLEDIMNTALGAGGNPYDSENAFDPGAAFTPTAGSPLAEMQTGHDAIEAVVDGIDPAGAGGTYETFVAKAASEVDTNLISETEIDNEVSAFETNQRARHLQAISRFTGGMQDINAVNSSQFIIGMALIESEFANNVDQFESSLRIQVKNAKQQLINQAVQQIIQILNLQVQAGMSVAQLQTEISRMKIVAKKEQVDRDLQIDVREILWDFQVVQFGIRALGGIGSPMPDVNEPSHLQSALGGAFSGAAAGFALSGGNPIGAGVGGLIGGLAGFFG